MPKYEQGKIVKGIVSGIEPYGIFIKFDEYYSGLIHISEISKGFVKDPNDFANIGDAIYTEIIGVDNENFHLKLSIKNIEYKKLKQPKKDKIVETKSGFKTLAFKLPIWIQSNLKEHDGYSTDGLK